MHSSINEITPYTTKDGSEIRELMHPDIHHNCNASLAEATIQQGEQTQHHLHRLSEEIYHITCGQGLMILGNKKFPVKPGDTVFIPCKTGHSLQNNGQTPLKVLCCCAPPYSHNDTEILSITG